MIKVKIEVKGDKVETSVKAENVTSQEVGEFLLALHQAKKTVMKQLEGTG